MVPSGPKPVLEIYCQAICDLVLDGTVPSPVILRVEVLENRPASIGFTENGDNIVLNLWGSILGEKKTKNKCKLCELCCRNQCIIYR